MSQGTVAASLVVAALLAGAATAATAPARDDPSVAGLEQVDLDGRIHRLGGRSGDGPVALVFLGVDCPISRKSIPKLNELAKGSVNAEAEGDTVELYGVLAEPALARAKAVAFAKEYAVALPLLLDTSGELAAALHPTHVPEAFVFSHGALVYRGAIDDAFADVGQERAQVKNRWLADAMAAVAHDEPPAVKSTEPVGCFFETPKSGAGGAVTYTRQVAPILNAHCVTCHRAGEVAPFPLTSFDDAAHHAKQIAKVTGKRLMPPWKPVEGFGTFLDAARLSERELALLAAWAEAGAPEGDAAELPPLPTFPEDWPLGKPDLVLEMPEPFTIEAAGRDHFRCFVLPTGLTQDQVVVGVDYRPGAPSVVHHAIFFLDAQQRGRKLDEKDEGPGYETFGGIGFFPSGGLGGYAPGATPHFMPEGTGRALEKGADVVLQVHYPSSGKVEHDQDKLALYFAKSPVKTLISGAAVLTNAIDIPAGAADYSRDASLTLPCPITVYGITPHMHYLGKTMEVKATAPDGSVIPLVKIDDWDFRWQSQYLYAAPIRLAKGTRIDLHAVYDNSAANVRNPSDPPKRVTHGEQTTDEMCIAFLQLATDSPEDRAQLRRTMLGELLRGGARER
ncbi:MAG TPA: alkyl hydroperoxide reductase [Planctomycetota bacterium]|nr:alkyl hydroperoxide reductase [Planctomycetota bacterium]